MAYGDLNFSTEQINEAISKSLEGGSSADIPVVIVSGSTPTQELQPNTFYEFGTVTSLTVTLAPEKESVYNEYLFQFFTGDNPATLTLPGDIVWIDNTPIKIEAYKRYQISIVNNLAIGGAF